MPIDIDPRKKDPLKMTARERAQTQEHWEVPAVLALSVTGVIGWAVIVFGGG